MRYHRSMKNLVKLEHYYTPHELERAVARLVEHHNHRRVHESLCNVTPADMYASRQQAILCWRERIKRETLDRRRREMQSRSDDGRVAPLVSVVIASVSGLPAIASCLLALTRQQGGDPYEVIVDRCDEATCT